VVCISARGTCPVYANLGQPRPTCPPILTQRRVTSI